MKTAARLAACLTALTAARAETPRLRQAELLRLGDDAVIRLTFDRPAAADAVRLLLAPGAVDAAASGVEATHRIDGLRFFTRARDPAVGAWDAVSDVAAVSDGPTLAILIPRAATAPRIRWAVEISDDRWRTIARQPAAGWNDTLLRAAPEAAPIVDDPLPADTFPLRAAQSLSQRFRDPTPDLPWAPCRWPIDPWPFRLLLREPGSRDSAAVEPSSAEQSGRHLRLKGAYRGMQWTLRFSPRESGWTIEGELSSDEERAVTAVVEWRLPPGEWTWHDDLDRVRRMAPGADPLRHVVPTAFGAGAQSRYPIGAVSGSDARIFVLEVPPDEPRLFRIEAEDGPPRLRAEFDLGLTAHTLNFPRRATFALDGLEFHGPSADAFRVAWSDYQRRHASLFERRLATAGFWLPDAAPGADVAELGPFWGVADPAQDRWLALRPFHARWPLGEATPSDPGNVLRRLRFFAAFDRGWTGLDARAALLAGARRQDGSLAITTGPGEAVAEINAHPAFVTPPSQPLNRAMAIWSAIAASRAANESVGALIEGIGALSALDFNRAALTAATYPAAWRTGAPEVGLAAPLAALEFLVPLSAALRAENATLALDLTGIPHPSFAGLADLSLCALPAPATPDAPAEWSARRVLAGPKPVVVLLDADFEQWSPADRRAFFEACLFYGFIPSPRRSTDNTSYWSQPRWFARDRASFRTYWPWIRRLAETGWTPRGPANAEAPGWRVEHFGAGPTLLLTMRRDAGAAAETSIRVPLAEGAVALDPLNGACETLTPVNGIASLRVRLNAGAAALRVVAPWTAVPAEAAFLKAWTSGAGEAAAAALNLRACIVESESGVAAELQTVEGRPRIRLINRGDGPAIVSDIRWSQGAVLRTFSADPRILAAGESVEAIGEWPAPAGGQRPWIEVRWRTQRGAQSWAAARAFHAADETPLP